MRIYKNISYNDKGRDINKLDVYTPDGDCEAVFLYIHGGGIEHGNKDDSFNLAPYLTSRAISLININYRKYPEASYPDFIEDAADAIAWSKRNIAELCGCDKLYVGGSSAGAYISMMLCFDKCFLGKVGFDSTAVQGYLHDAGQPTTHFNVLKYSGVDSRRVIIDERAPIYHIGNEPSYPPMRFLVSDDDMENRYEQTMLAVGALRHFRYENHSHKILDGKHCSYFYRTDENGDNLLSKEIYDFIKWAQKCNEI